MLPTLRPGFWSEVFDLPVGRGGQPGEHVAEVGEGVEATAAAAFDEGVEDGAAFAGLGVADEEPVFLADRGGADGVFDQVIVDLDATVFEEDVQRGPLVEGVVDGFAQEALW